MKIVQLLTWLLTFTLYLCIADGKEVGQISKLVPLDDWADFKNRTKDVKPIDKLLGKLRATYDFVFHKMDNVSNVGKILGKVAEDDNGEKVNNMTESLVRKEKTDVEKLEKLEDAPPLDRLEIIDDEYSVLDRSLDDKMEQLDSTTQSAHSKFHLPYAIAQAFLRWLITLYYSTTSQAGAYSKEVVSD